MDACSSTSLVTLAAETSLILNETQNPEVDRGFISTLIMHQDNDTMAAAQTARQVYGMETPPYMPHLSLLYRYNSLLSKGVI